MTQLAYQKKNALYLSLDKKLLGNKYKKIDPLSIFLRMEGFLIVEQSTYTYRISGLGFRVATCIDNQRVPKSEILNPTSILIC